jgi:hypothetical protein
MDGFVAFAALCLASAAFCREMSARNDIQGERQMDKAVPSAHATKQDATRQTPSRQQSQ